VSHLSRRRAFGTPRADLRRTQDSGGSGEGPISKSRRAANDGSSRSAHVCSGRSVVSVSHLVVALSEESHSFHDSGLPIRVFHADPQSASKQIFETKPDHAAYVRRGNGEDGIGGENEEANTHVGPNAQVLQPPAQGVQELDASSDKPQAIRLGMPARFAPHHHVPKRGEQEVTDGCMSTFPGREIGALPVRTERLAREATRRGHEVEVSRPHPPRRSRRESVRQMN
jgi:hypothetical protein